MFQSVTRYANTYIIRKWIKGNGFDGLGILGKLVCGMHTLCLCPAQDAGERGKEMKELTERQKEIKGMLTCSCRNYSSKMAEADLLKITKGYYHLDGWTKEYVILTKDMHTIVRQKTSHLGLKEMVIAALDLYLGFHEECTL